MTHALLEAGSSRGAAFPSSHVGVSVAACFACWRWQKPLAPLVTLLTVGLALGAVYGGFHYAIDALAGAGFGAALAACAPALRRSLDGRVRP
jgi:membrane-associated phospholipid phosphatase